MTLPAWHEEAIAKGHDRNAFDCGDAGLNEFLRRYARQSHERGGAKTFVTVEVGGVMLIIDAKSDRAATWYASYGAVPLRDTARILGNADEITSRSEREGMPLGPPLQGSFFYVSVFPGRCPGLPLGRPVGAQLGPYTSLSYAPKRAASR